MCKFNKDSASCRKASGCQWYQSKGCYAGGSKTSEGKKDSGKGGDTYALDTKDVKTPQWQIVDKLIAPKEAGDYILQWRWDNEQTPQIWTTCADLRVVAPSTSSENTTALLLSSSATALHEASLYILPSALVMATLTTLTLLA